MPIPRITLRLGQEHSGFVVKAVTPLPEVRAIVYQLEHAGSGARLIHLHTDDAENLFAVTFPTPPPDDTGLPHILEHAVLSGSENYPVRDPFFEMCKISMATFINAMTGSDATYYPVASNVKQDLFNLAEVYFDAVFHPLLTEQTFRREGHHLAPADPEAPTGEITVSGIVYNEMKGAFSDPESRLYRSAARGLFPDTIYGRESGGDPACIPDLTYEDFKRFYKTYYHPSNAHFVLYGDIPTAEHLAFLGPKLDEFRRTHVAVPADTQPRWEAPRTQSDSYPIGDDEPSTEKTYLTLSWIVGDATDAEDAVAMYLLSLILLGNEAALLRKPLVDSKLGQDVILSGLHSMGRENVFSVGLKGAEPDRRDAFVQLVTEVLTGIADAPIPHDRVAAAFQQTTYHYQEIVRMYPLTAMQRVLSAWLHGSDPLTFLQMRTHLQRVRDRYEADPQLFRSLITERLLNNPHRLTVVLEPDSTWQPREDAEFADRMRAVRRTYTVADMHRLAAEAEELERTAGTPNSPEAIARLPQLTLADLPKSPKHITTAVETLSSGVELLRNEVFANGVNYVAFDVDLRGLPQDQWAYLPRYAEAVAKLGAAGMGFEEIAVRKAAATGGVGCWPEFQKRADSRESVLAMRFRMKALDEQIDQALGVLHDLLFTVDPRDRDRLFDVLVQTRARYRTDFVHDGSHTASSHAARGLGPELFLSDRVSGLPQLALAEELIGAFGESADTLMSTIEAIRDFMLSAPRLTVSFTGSDQAYDRLRATLSGWTGTMVSEAAVDAGTGFEPFRTPPREGLAGPIQVAHCAMAMPAPHYSDADEPLVTLGAHLVSFDYLISEIRLKGNAYGAWCMYDPFLENLILGSFRDPRISQTIGVFNGVREYVAGTNWSQTDVDRAIIAIAKRDERPIRPESATTLALQRHRVGLTASLREQRYQALIAATPREIKRALLQALDAGLPKAAVCVVSSRAKLEEANREMPGHSLEITDILCDSGA